MSASGVPAGRFGTMTSAPTDCVPSQRADGYPAVQVWRELSWLRPTVLFAAVFGAWVGFLAVALASEHLIVRSLIVAPLILASGLLFTLAHDAGHRSYSSSAFVNGVVGRVGLIPSAHVFGLWRAHHEVHHRYTNLRSRDFVWTPLSVAEFRALSWWRRVLHRLYRHRSGLGLGLHYTIEIWMPRMLRPRAKHGLRLSGPVLFDSAVLLGALVGLAAAARWYVGLIDPDRVGDSGFWLSSIMLLFVVPMLGTHWLIGFVIYLNHTHPDIVWYDDENEWTRRDVQLEGSTGLCFSRLRHALIPRRIMNHTAHHVDPAIPLRHLGRAQHDLVEVFGDRIVSYDWSLKRFREILSRCKLYDYGSQRWLTYADAERQP